MTVNDSVQENSRIIMDKVQGNGRMTAKSKLQDCGRMPRKGKNAGVGAGKSCGLCQGIIQN